MADDTSRLEALVARLIQDKLGQEGGLEDLLRAVREVEQSFSARDESGNEGGEPVRVDTAFAGEGTLKGEVNAVVVPTVRATMTLLPQRSLSYLTRLWTRSALPYRSWPTRFTPARRTPRC